MQRIPRTFRAALLAVGLGSASGMLLAGATARPARADDYDNASRQLLDLEERIRKLSADFKDAPPPDPNAADRRVVEAQTLFELKSYTEAASLLLDVVEKYQNTRAYDDAIVLLGECLYQDGDLASARRYFEQAIAKNTASLKEQQALNRLIEISLRTGDYEHVDDYLTRLSRIPAANQDPAVPYVRGKYYYFRDRPDDALAAFTTVAQTNPYYLQARYFIATIQVKRGDLANAATSFDAVLRVQPRTDADKEVQDLARLAIGRILYERGQFDKAKEIYATVPRSSKYWPDAQYEYAWNAIKGNDFKGAYRSLDLLLLQDPDSPRAPELRLLMGNLNLRLNNFFVASETFGKTRDEFEPIHKQLLASLAQSQSDPAYIENLLGNNIEKFDVAAFLPQGAAKWARGEPDVAQMLGLVTEVGDLQKGIHECDELLVKLERAVNGSGKVGIFPDLASSRVQSREILNRSLSVRQKFLPRTRALALPFMNAEDKAALDQNAAQRASLEQVVTDLPLTAEDLKKRDTATQGDLIALDRQAADLNVQVHALEAEVVAIEQYFLHSKGQQKIKPEDLQQPLGDLKTSVSEARKLHDEIRDQIAEAQRQTSVAGAAGEGERTAVARLGELIADEQAILQRARNRMSPGSVGEFDSLTNLIARANEVQRNVLSFDERVDRTAESRLGSIREKLVTERAQLQAESTQLGTIVGESQSLGGGLAQAVLKRVTDRFYDIVVQSDVGLIDVSWGLKDQKTSTLSKLVNQQKLEFKAVDEDFKALLQEEEK